MSDKTGIQWCDATVNFWWGCTKVASPSHESGCKFCYAETLAARWAPQKVWGPSSPRWIIPSAPDLMRKLERRAVREGRRLRVFIQSMSDFFEDHHGPIIDKHGNVLHGLDLNQLRYQAYPIFDECPHLDLLILTKRPGNIPTMWMPRFVGDGGFDGYRPNVWLGFSAEDQPALDWRAEQLKASKHLCKYTFVSLEPLLGPITHMPDWLDWAIVGGESGSHARPIDPAWFGDIHRQCERSGTAFFFKQWGTVQAKALGLKDSHGGDWNEWPEALRVRQFPDQLQEA